MNPRRMEAEAVRDNLLHVAGELDPTMGGPDIDPDGLDQVPAAEPLLPPRHGEAGRSSWRSSTPPNPNACYRREESVVPQQALALANSPLGAGTRAAAGERPRSRRGPRAGADAAFIASAFVRVLGRAPIGRASRMRFRADNASAARARPDGRTATGAAARSLVHVLINHNDFVTIR